MADPAGRCWAAWPVDSGLEPQPGLQGIDVHPRGQNSGARCPGTRGRGPGGGFPTTYQGLSKISEVEANTQPKICSQYHLSILNCSTLTYDSWQNELKDQQTNSISQQNIQLSDGAGLYVSKFLHFTSVQREKVWHKNTKFSTMTNHTRITNSAASQINPPTKNVRWIIL